MRRNARKALPREEEEEEEEELDLDMEDEDEDMDGMTLEDLLSPEELELLGELIAAVETRNLEQVKDVVARATAAGMKKEILVNAPAPEDEDGNNVLMIAFAMGNEEMARYLMDQGAEAVTVNGEGDNCFSLACQGGFVNLISLLLEKGKVKLFGAIDEEGNGALHLAARGHVDALKFILDKGAFINVPASESKATALHMAVSSNAIDNVKLLLERKADVNKQTAMGLTPLMLCADEDSPTTLAIAQLLVEAKADVNKVDAGGATAYDIAESNGAYAFAAFLLEKGATPKGVSANTIGLETINVQRYYNKGDAPGSRTRVAQAVLGSTLYVAGGLKGRTSEQIMAEMEAAGDNFDPENLLPFAPSAEVFSTDLTKISVLPLVEDLSKLKSTHGATLKLSEAIKGDHLNVNADGVVEVKYEAEDCCGEAKECCDKKEDAPCCADDECDEEFTTSILAEESYTQEHGPIAYYEVTFLEGPVKTLIASIGWTTAPGEWAFERHPGWVEDSVGYHSDDGKPRVPIEDGDEAIWIGNPWGVKDTVGAGHIFATGETFFTLNGRFLGVFSVGEEFCGTEVRPVVGVGSNGVKFQANFGTKPFRFNFHVPTATWTKLPDLPSNVLSIFPLPGSEDSLLVIPDSTKAIYHWTPSTGAIVTKETKAVKIPAIPAHAEHSVSLLGNKVILFARLETLLNPGKRKNAVFYVLDLNTNTWSDILAPSTLNQKKLAKALLDADCQLSGTVINGNYYIFSPERAYQLNLDNLSLTAHKLNGLVPQEDMAFTNIKDSLSLCYAMSPNLTTYRFNLIDIAKKQWYLPRFNGAVIEPTVGKTISAYNGKLFSFGGFSSETTAPKDLFFSMSLTAAAPSGIAAAFDNKEFHSDFVVKVGADKSLNLHKAILAARSCYFAEILDKDASAATHELPGAWNVNFATAVLKYLYTDSIDYSLVNATNYKEVAEIVKIIAPSHLNRIMQEILFSRTLDRSTFAADLKTIANKFTDLTIQATGGSVKAHKVVLASRCAEIKAKVAASSEITLAHPVAAVEQLVTALYDVCEYSLSDVPRDNWEPILAVAKELKVCCMDKCIAAAQNIVV